MFFKRNVEDINEKIKLEEERNSNVIRNCNSLILSNTILLIPLVYTIIECLNRFKKVRTLVLIFGLILVGCILVSNFLAMLTNHLDSFNNKKKLMFVSYLLSSSIYLLLFIFIMVIMIVL